MCWTKLLIRPLLFLLLAVLTSQPLEAAEVSGRGQSSSMEVAGAKKVETVGDRWAFSLAARPMLLSGVIWPCGSVQTGSSGQNPGQSVGPVLPCFQLTSALHGPIGQIFWTTTVPSCELFLEKKIQISAEFKYFELIWIFNETATYFTLDQMNRFRRFLKKSFFKKKEKVEPRCLSMESRAKGNPPSKKSGRELHLSVIKGAIYENNNKKKKWATRQPAGRVFFELLGPVIDFHWHVVGLIWRERWPPDERNTFGEISVASHDYRIGSCLVSFESLLSRLSTGRGSGRSVEPFGRD